MGQHLIARYTGKMDSNLDLQSLNNDWFCLRHGQSEANVQQRVASDPATAIHGFGLTGAGRAQILNTFAGTHLLDHTTRIFCSDFKRTQQSAHVAAGCLQCTHPITADSRLRERVFGDFEAASAAHYETVWQLDQSDPHHTTYNVESVVSVALRMCDLIKSLDARYERQRILLVSHGDPLQIVECCFRGHDIADHRGLEPLLTAELRALSSIR